jgi:hypothetical protein
VARPTRPKPSRRPASRKPGYADSVAIIVIAAILVMIAVIYGLTHLGNFPGAPVSSPTFTPREESPSPSASPSPTAEPSPSSSPTESPLPTMSPYSNPSNR